MYSDILSWVDDKKEKFSLEKSKMFYDQYRGFVDFSGSNYEFLNELKPVINVMLEFSRGGWFAEGDNAKAEGNIHIDISMNIGTIKTVIEHEMLHFIQYLIRLYTNKDGKDGRIGGLPPKKNIFEGVSMSGFKRQWGFKNNNDNARSINYVYADVDIGDVVMDKERLELFKKVKEDGEYGGYREILVHAPDEKEAKKKFMEMFPTLKFYGAREKTQSTKNNLVNHPLRPVEYYPNANSLARLLKRDYAEYISRQNGYFSDKFSENKKKISKIDFFKSVLSSSEFRDRELSMQTYYSYDKYKKHMTGEFGQRFWTEVWKMFVNSEDKIDKNANTKSLIRTSSSDLILPALPGTIPIPEGYVRLYHQTSRAAVPSILREGILWSKARGIEGPKAIYADENGFYGKPGDHPTIEFSVPQDRWDKPFVLCDVLPENIIAAHLPWHMHARFIDEEPEAIKNTLEGEFDDLGGDYPLAIQYIKNKYGNDTNKTANSTGRIVCAEYTFKNKLDSLRGEMVSVAQKIYDEWEQDEDGNDVELGSGGICQDIAGGICDVLGGHGINSSTLHAEIGEQHVWVVAWEHDEKVNDEYNVYSVDINPYTYETGGGYTWKKIHDVVFSVDDIQIHKTEESTVDYVREQ